MIDKVKTVEESLIERLENENKDLQKQNRVLLAKIRELEMSVNIYRHDSLTGFKMRRDFEMEIFNMCEKLDKFYLYIIDINGLHSINREKGYDAGDKLIKFVADEIVENIKGIPFRLGGDEFAVLSLEKQDVKIPKSIVGVGCSSDYETIDEFIKGVDGKVIEAKKVLYKGRNDRRKNES